MIETFKRKEPVAAGVSTHHSRPRTPAPTVKQTFPTFVMTLWCEECATYFFGNSSSMYLRRPFDMLFYVVCSRARCFRFFAFSTLSFPLILFVVTADPFLFQHVLATVEATRW